MLQELLSLRYRIPQERLITPSHWCGKAMPVVETLGESGIPSGEPQHRCSVFECFSRFGLGFHTLTLMAIPQHVLPAITTKALLSGKRLGLSRKIRRTTEHPPGKGIAQALAQTACSFVQGLRGAASFLSRLDLPQALQRWRKQLPQPDT